METLVMAWFYKEIHWVSILTHHTITREMIKTRLSYYKKKKFRIC